MAVAHLSFQDSIPWCANTTLLVVTVWELSTTQWLFHLDPQDITDKAKSGEYAGCGKTVNPKDASVPVVWWLVCELAMSHNKALAVPISLCTVAGFSNESEWWCCRMSQFLVVPQGSHSTIRTPSMPQMTMSTFLSVKGVVQNFFRQGLLSCFHYTAFSLHEYQNKTAIHLLWPAWQRNL